MLCKHIKPQQTFNKVQQTQASIIFLLTGKKISYIMAYLQISTTSPSASGTKKQRCITSPTSHRRSQTADYYYGVGGASIGFVSH